MRREDLRNIVIIAHVDHGKTSLVDCLLRQSGQYRDSQLVGDCILDSNELERERGITILAKNIALPYRGVKINIIDTPGHADFGGEVERVLRMADGALVLIDAAEGVMPQTRFVLTKALQCRLKPIILINKIDRPDARPFEVLDEAFDLLMELEGGHHLQEFPFIFTTAREGYATESPAHRGDSMRPLLDLVLQEIPGPDVEPDAPLQMLVTTLDWSEYVGRIAIGRIQAGTLHQGQTVALLQADDRTTTAKIVALYVFENLGRLQVDQAEAGDIVAIVGLEQVEIGDTICHPDHPRPMPRLSVDEPTLEMVFTINNSPFAGRDGKYVTSRQLRERLYRELERNVALRVEPLEDSDGFRVSGRGAWFRSARRGAARRGRKRGTARCPRSARPAGRRSFQLAVQPLAEVAAGEVLAFAAGKGRGVDAEGHLQRRLVDLQPRQRPGMIRVADRVADLDLLQADDGDDVAGVGLVDLSAAEVLEDVERRRSWRASSGRRPASGRRSGLVHVPDCTRPMAIRPT